MTRREKRGMGKEWEKRSIESNYGGKQASPQTILMKLLILCVVLRNYHDTSTVRARARELIISDTEEDIIISPSSAGLMAATRAGQGWDFLQPTAMEEAKRSSPGMLQAGCSGLPPAEGFGQMGSILCSPSWTFPLFPPTEPTSQPTGSVRLFLMRLNL